MASVTVAGFEGVALGLQSFLIEFCQQATSAFDGLLEQHGSEMPDLGFVASLDIMETARTFCALHDEPFDPRAGVERIGGRVAGKSMTSPDLATAEVIFDRALLAEDGNETRAFVAFLITHELAHVYTAMARGPQFPLLPSAYKPWDVAPVMGRIAADEYRADMLSYVITTRLLGRQDPAELLPAELHRSMLPSSADVLVPGLARLVQDYRESGIGLDAVYQEVVSATAGALNLAAHVEAEACAMGKASPLLEHDHPAVVHVLAPLWAPLATHFAERPVLVSPGGWEQELHAIDAVVPPAVFDFWGRLGLSFEDLRPDFHIRVAAPERVLFS